MTVKCTITFETEDDYQNALMVLNDASEQMQIENPFNVQKHVAEREVEAVGKYVELSIVWSINDSILHTNINYRSGAKPHAPKVRQLICETVNFGLDENDESRTEPEQVEIHFICPRVDRIPYTDDVGNMVDEQKTLYTRS